MVGGLYAGGKQQQQGEWKDEEQCHSQGHQEQSDVLSLEEWNIPIIQPGNTT